MQVNFLVSSSLVCIFWGCEIFAYDHTIKAPPRRGKNIKYFKTGLGTGSSQLKTLNDLITQNNHTADIIEYLKVINIAPLHSCLLRLYQPLVTFKNCFSATISLDLMKRCHIPGLLGGMETQGEETICMRRFKDQINIRKTRHNQSNLRFFVKTWWEIRFHLTTVYIPRLTLRALSWAAEVSLTGYPRGL